MEFTASDGTDIPEQELKLEINFTIKKLKQNDISFILPWERKFLEWFLDKEIECKNRKGSLFKIELHEDVTEDDLEQLEQLIDYLEF